MHVLNILCIVSSAGDVVGEAMITTVKKWVPAVCRTSTPGAPLQGLLLPLEDFLTTNLRGQGL